MLLPIILFALLVIFTIYAFSTLKKKKVQEFPKEWEAALVKRVLFYKKLSEADRAIFRKRMMAFLAEINIEGVKMTVTDEERMLIAASAVIPVFGFGDWHYNNLNSVLIYPDNFNENLEFTGSANGRMISGMVGTGRFEGQMLLSKRAVHHAFDNKTDKHNTPVHEFVHLLDKLDGDTDGLPERLLENQYMIPWVKLMHDEMEAINNDKSDIRKYGGTSETEFFAVVSEYFFERPDLFKRKHPELHEMLVRCFQQNQ